MSRATTANTTPLVSRVVPDSVLVADYGVAAVRVPELAAVTAWRAPDLEDVWLDPAVAEGSSPVDPVLAVLTAWGPYRDAAYALACAASDQLVIEGPVVRRPEALGGINE